MKVKQQRFIKMLRHLPWVDEEQRMQLLTEFTHTK